MYSKLRLLSAALGFLFFTARAISILGFHQKPFAQSPMQTPDVLKRIRYHLRLVLTFKKDLSLPHNYSYMNLSHSSQVKPLGWVGWIGT
jgi:hypothetical protein